MSTEAWKAENSLRLCVRVTNNSGIPGALQKMMEATGESYPQYIRRVVTESLIRDGYLQKPNPVKK